MHPLAIPCPPWWSGLSPRARAVVIALVWVVALGDCRGSAFAEGPPATAEAADLGSQVHAIFSKKCTQCHGTHLRKPKGKFGYVTDLNKVAADPKIVVPSRPEKSKLWKMVENDEMPPEEAKAGPLTADQKQVIQSWIAAGAPPPSPARSAPPPAPTEADEQESAPAPFSVGHLLGWIGKFHVTVIHFPIALLLAAALGELWCAWRGERTPWPPVQFCVLLAAAGAAVAVPLGWLLADKGGAGASEPEILRLHRWLGTTVGVCAVSLAALSQVDAHRQRRSWPFRVLLWISALLVGAAGHFGGLLVHGEDFFQW
jgi:hypothetical protein